MRLLEDFNEITNNKYKYLRLTNMTVLTAKAKVTIKLLAPSELLGSVINEEAKQEIFSAIRQLIPMSLELDIEYHKSYVDEERAIKTVCDYFAEKHPSIDSSHLKIDVNIADSIINIKITLNKLYYDYMESNVEALKEYLAKCYCNDCNIELVEEYKEIDFEVKSSGLGVTEKYYKRRVVINNVKHVYGKAIMIEPKYLVDCKGEEKDAVYCGKIVEFARRISKKSNCPYYIMSIDDTSSRMSVKAFTKSDKHNAYDDIMVGDTIVVQGDVAYDTYSKEISMMIRNIARCDIEYGSIILEAPPKKAPEYYSIIKPTPYVDTAQIDIFSIDKAVEIPLNLVGRDFVVFDVETTGLVLNSTKVIEIAGVKIRNGKIIECFSSFCNPREQISEQISNLTHITNDMLSDAPFFEDIFPDFYKFTRGAELVAHNSSFDMGYILREAKNLNFYMDNIVHDTINVAKKSRRTYDNYKLITLCSAEGIVNEGAHRAIFDAIATAKLLIKLAEFI